jgi:hypothetical protein
LLSDALANPREFCRQNRNAHGNHHNGRTRQEDEGDADQQKKSAHHANNNCADTRINFA